MEPQRQQDDREYEEEGIGCRLGATSKLVSEEYHDEDKETEVEPGDPCDRRAKAKGWTTRWYGRQMALIRVSEDRPVELGNRALPSGNLESLVAAVRPGCAILDEVYAL